MAVETTLKLMPLFIRIPTILVVLGLLLSGGQSKVCDFVALAGINVHAPAETCTQDDVEHSHSDPVPCSEGCLVELREGVAPTQDAVPTLLATEGLDFFLSVNFVSFPETGFFNPVTVAWHGPPLEFPPSLHSDPLFSGRFLV